MDQLLTLSEAATWLRKHEDTVLKFIKDGQLEAAKVGRDWRIKQEALEDYLESRTVKASKKKSATFKA